MSPPLFLAPDCLDALLTPQTSAQLDLSALLVLVYERRYCGALTLHFQDGKPRVVEFKAPQFKLASD